MLKPRYRWIMEGYNEQDGWVRWFDYAKTEEMAWETINWFARLKRLSGDCDDVRVRKTIVFNTRRSSTKPTKTDSSDCKMQ